MNFRADVFKLRVQVALLAVVIAFAYGNSLFNGFTMDDDLYILRNPQVTGHSLRLILQPHASSNVFRPVTFATFALNWLVSGDKPFGYHLLNLVLHFAVVVLLLALLRELLEGMESRDSVCFAAALLFAVHPIHTEAVSSIVGRSELLAAGFLLAAWILHLRDRSVLALLSFALALLSKESAVGLLLLVLAGDYAKGRFKPWIRYAGLTGVTLVYVGALWKIQGGHFGAANVSVLDNPLILLPAHLRILNALRIAWKYVGLLFFPAKLSCDYSYNQISLYSDARHLLLPMLAAVAVTASWFWAIAKRSVAYLIAGCIYFVGFAATSNVLTPTGTIMGERLVYFPSAGFCLLAALAWSWLASRKKSVAYAILAAMAIALAVRTVIRNRDWHDNATLYAAAAEAVPKSAKMRSFRGSVYLGRNQFELARTEFRTALSIYPDYPPAIEALGLLEMRTGNSSAALELMQKALERSDRKDIDYDYRAVNLAALQIQIGKLDDALALLNRQIQGSPAYSRAWSNRAVLRLKLQQFPEARSDAEQALRLDAHNTQARAVLDHLADATGSDSLR